MCAHAGNAIYANAGKFKMSILQLGPVIFGETDQLITYLQGKDLLASNKTCLCGSAMPLSSRCYVSDGVRFSTQTVTSVPQSEMAAYRVYSDVCPKFSNEMENMEYHRPR